MVLERKVAGGTYVLSRSFFLFKWLSSGIVFPPPSQVKESGYLATDCLLVARGFSLLGDGEIIDFHTGNFYNSHPILLWPIGKSEVSRQISSM